MRALLGDEDNTHSKEQQDTPSQMRVHQSEQRMGHGLSSFPTALISFLSPFSTGLQTLVLTQVFFNR